MLLEDILEVMKDNKDCIYYDDMTYGMLYENVKKLYNYLLTIKKEKDNKIIVYGSKSIYMVISFLACSYAGITYVPVDTSCTEDRLNSIIGDVKPLCILKEDEVERIINNLESSIKELEPLLKEEDIYYILFTSGSTGKPKGVQITYKNLSAFAKRILATIPVKKSCILNQALYSFDLSVADIYLTLLTASEYIPLEKFNINEYSKIIEKAKKANVFIVTPTFLDFLLTDKNFNEYVFSNLDYIYLCGEILQEQTVKRLFERFKAITLINAYGPTECTVAITSTIITDQKDIAVGEIKDNNFALLDDNLNEVGENIKANIVIYGDQVSNGYINYPNDSFISYKEKRAYITGDIGYVRNGKLYFVSRKDRQIKLGGYRIELGEIESKISEIEGIQKCIAVPKYKEDKVEKIIAYVITALTEKELKNKVKEKLPIYMVPSIKIVDELPINNNFKIDIKKIEEEENERRNN